VFLNAFPDIISKDFFQHDQECFGSAMKCSEILIKNLILVKERIKIYNSKSLNLPLVRLPILNFLKLR